MPFYSNQTVDEQNTNGYPFKLTANCEEHFCMRGLSFVSQGLQILLMSGVSVTSASQILESFWNIWSQVSQRKKPFSDFPARGPGMYTLS